MITHIQSESSSREYRTLFDELDLPIYVTPLAGSRGLVLSYYQVTDIHMFRLQFCQVVV